MADDVQRAKERDQEADELRLRRRPGDVVVLEPPCDLSAPRVAWLREELLGALDRTSGTLVVDLSRVRLLDSAGLSLFISLHKRAARRHVALALSGASTEIDALLRLTRFDRIVPVFPDIEAALRDVPRSAGTGPLRLVRSGHSP